MLINALLLVNALSFDAVDWPFNPPLRRSMVSPNQNALPHPSGFESCLA
jgi:hypothetical protein